MTEVLCKYVTHSIVVHNPYTYIRSSAPTEASFDIKTSTSRAHISDMLEKQLISS